MTVRRTLPQRERSLIGAWCFLDHYGPDDVADTGGMSVAPHPHTGLQTVSLAVHRRDRAPRQRRPPRDGAARRAEPDDRRPRHQPLRGLDRRDHGRCTAPSCGSRCRPSARDGAPGFDHYAPAAVTGRGLGGAGLPRLAARRHLAGRDRARRCSAPSCCSPPAPSCTSTSTRRSSTASWSTPASSRSATSRPSSTSSPTCRPAPSGSRSTAVTDARVLLLGGPPFGEAIVMWWNFVGRSHEEVVALPRGVAGPARGRRVRRRPVRHPDRRRPAADPGAAAAQRAAQGTALSPVGGVGQDVRHGTTGR